MMLVIALGGDVSADPLGTAFSYQGRLSEGGAPANGVYDLRAAVFDTPVGGTALGNPLTNAATPVNNGAFTLTLDFGAVFDGNARWLELGVRTNGASGFTSLSPRQVLTPTPYAVYAGNAALATSAAGVAATNILGTLAASQLSAAVVTNGAGGLNLSGAFSGNGAGLTNLAVALAYPLTNLSTGLRLADEGFASNAAALFVQCFSNMVAATFASNSFAGITNALGYLPATNGNANPPISSASQGPITLSISGTNVALTATPSNACVDNVPLHYRLTMTTNVLIQNPTGLVDGQRVIIEFIQDSLGNRQVFYDSAFGFGTDITGTMLTAAANKRDFATFIYCNGKWYCVAFVRGY